MPTPRSLAQYRFLWLTFGSAVAILASLVFRDLTRAGLLFFTLVLASILLLGSLPRLAPRPAEAMFRLRWTAIFVAGLLAFAVLGRRHGLYLLAGLSLVWLSVVNLLVFALRRFGSGALAPFEAVIYFLGDLWLAAVLAYLGLGWYYVAAMLAVSAVLVTLSGRTPLWMFIAMLAIYAGFLPLVLPARAITFALYLAAIITGLCLLGRLLEGRLPSALSSENRNQVKASG